MKPKFKQELQTLHKMLVQKFKTMKFDVKLYLESSTQLLRNDFCSTSSSEEEHFFIKYSAYMTALFNMLEKTTDYVCEMMSNMEIAKNLLTSEYCFPFISFDDDEHISSSVCSDETLIDSKRNSCFIESGLISLSENNCSYESNDNFSLNNMNPFKMTMDITNTITKRPKIPCGTMDTSIFKPGSIIPCASICSKDPNSFGFCIFINDSPDSELLNQLNNKKDYQTYTFYPEQGVVFGMRIENCIVRAVRCLPLSTKKVYLPDFGDIVDMENNLSNILYLTEEEQNIPGQAIPCQWHNVLGSTDYSKDQTHFFTLPLYEQMSFLIHNILNGVLYLSPHQKTTTEGSNDNQTYTPLSPKDWELLNEEPPSTSNALKAVLGHVPKDELRICTHYDPRTDSCFKGSNCRREHIQMPTEYFTKDKEPANLFAEKPSMAPIIYPTNEVIEVLVTHIRSLDYFYGIIVDPQKPVHNPFIWADSDIPESDLFNTLPSNFEVVLAKFNDGNWYRAQVVDTYKASKEVFVFYLDYGNRQIVNLENIAKCSQSVAELPAKVQEFRLAYLHVKKTQDQEILKQGLRKLIEQLTDHCIKVSVVSHHEDLLVKLLEEPYCKLPKILEDMHCVEIIEMY